MAELAIQQVSLSGVGVGLVAAAAGGDTFPNAGREVLVVNNGDTTATTITIAAVHRCNQGFQHDAVVTVPAGERREIGPFPLERFGSRPGVAYSKVTALTVAAVRR